MPGGRDKDFGRPPRRKSWEENAAGVDQSGNGQAYGKSRNSRRFEEANSQSDPSSDTDAEFQSDSESDSDSDFNGRGGGPAAYSRGARRPSQRSQTQGTGRTGSRSNPYAGNGRPVKVEEADDDDRAAKAKDNKKRLLKLLGNEALCLIIIFGLISTFNWMASDYSGDYMGKNDELTAVELSITRRATTVDAELTYGSRGLLQLDKEKDQPTPKEGQPIKLDFTTPPQWLGNGRESWQATFKGRINGDKAVGTISDSTGDYKVNLSKNVLTSLFRQLQSHIPQFPSIPLPSLFDEKDKARQSKHS